jgi:hypothetical protein
MKLFIHYEDSLDTGCHKTSKISLPEKWLVGPLTPVLELFVSSYNQKYPRSPLVLDQLHLETGKGDALSNDCVVSQFLADNDDVYVKHGPAPVLADMTAPRIGVKSAAAALAPPKSAPNVPVNDSMLACRRFGCQKKYDPVHNHEAACSFHRLPPVFHETVKFWSCCPEKKCYSWDTFLEVKGCQLGAHTNEKPTVGVLGGCDVRSGNDGSEEVQTRLKSIDEYNAERKQQSVPAGAAAGDSISKMYALRQAMDKAGVPGAPFDKAKEKLSGRLRGDHVAVATEMSACLTACLEAISAD